MIPVKYYELSVQEFVSVISIFLIAALLIGIAIGAAFTWALMS